MKIIRVLWALSVAMISLQTHAQDSFADLDVIKDSHLTVLLRNAYISRDYKNGRQDKAEWGQAAIADLQSGFSNGPVGFGIDGFATYAVRLDGGAGRSGANGIDFFKQDAAGHPAPDLARAGASIKVRVANTVFRYGDLKPALPVLNTDDSRLLPESFTGWMVTSDALAHTTLTAGHFTAQARKSANGRDNGGLQEINVLGGRYDISASSSISVYASDVKDHLKRYYLGASKVIALDARQSVTLDFNGYKTDIDRTFADSLGTGTDNKIWSAALTYAVGAHQFTLAQQRSTGDAGYVYGGYQSAGYVGDGGGTIFLSNSYWSDFNAQGERSWHFGYGIDLATYGLPGLSYRIAYLRGSDIQVGNASGTERELFNQLQYVIQGGPAKDLKLRLRSSWLRVSNDVRDYNEDGNEIRVFVDYPFSLF
ncbi:OprD family outer membrane porin [Pseudomonas sp. GZD-222]|uniref:OprD family outer membrane porin n=1 Tax=Pseudomonas sp. GZD-222 TaxID=3404805 RepID=UPI003BB5719B